MAQLLTPIRSVASPARRIHQFEEILQLYSHWDGPVAQLSCGRFEGTVRIARSRNLTVQHGTANQALLVRGREREKVMNFSLVTPESSRCLWHDRRLDPGCLVMRGSGADVDFRSSRTAGNVSFFVAEDAIRAAVQALHGRELESVTWKAMAPAPEQFELLKNRLERFLQVAGMSGPENPEVRQLEQACIAAAVSVAFPEVNGYPIDLPCSAQIRLVRLAEDLMQSRLDTPTGEIDLCAELGVSGRTLRLAFRKQFGLGPMAYFQTMRLNAARDLLKSADAETQSIANIAQKCGFSHLGKFAGYYRRLFGELPSETLRG
jgi:AraC family ethanolamine operon transcriptional activator